MVLIFCLIWAQTVPEGAWVCNLDQLDEIPDVIFNPMVGPNEHVYFIDPRSSRVFHIDENGIFLRTYGRQGQGPGEFMFPQYFTVSAESGSIYVGDTQRKILWAFAADGTFRGAHFEDQKSNAFALGDESILSIKEHDPFTEPNRGCSLVIRKRGEPGEILLKEYSSKEHQDWLIIEHQGARGLFKETWIRRLLVAVSPDQTTFFAGSNDKLAFDVCLVTDLKTAGRIEDLSLPNLPLEDEEVSSRKSIITLGNKKFTLADFDLPPTKPVVAEIFCDSAQRLWVRLTKRHQQRDTHYRVYEKSGTLAGKFVFVNGQVFHADRQFIWITSTNREGDQLLVKTPYSLETVP